MRNKKSQVETTYDYDYWASILKGKHGLSLEPRTATPFHLYPLNNSYFEPADVKYEKSNILRVFSS